MEEEIEEKLKSKYTNMKIEVKYIDLRKYKINVKINADNIEYEKDILYLWDAHYTKDVNITTISNIIDNYILKIYRKEK